MLELVRKVTPDDGLFHQAVKKDLTSREHPGVRNVDIIGLSCKFLVKDFALCGILSQPLEPAVLLRLGCYQLVEHRLSLTLTLIFLENELSLGRKIVIGKGRRVYAAQLTQLD